MSTLERFNPDSIHRPGPYSHGVFVSARPLLFIAGQIALDKDGQLVGANDLGAQARQALLNIQTILATKNATFNNLIKVQVFVVNYQPDYRPILREVMQDFFDEDHLPVSTLVGIQSLAQPQFLIEIEGIAAL